MKTGVTIVLTCTECRQARVFRDRDVDNLDATILREGWRYTGQHSALCPECDRRLDQEYAELYR